MGQFLHKPKPTHAGFPKAKLASPGSKGVAARNSSSEVSDTSLQEAESRAARKREWVEATQISERRHALLAKLQSGEVSRESIDPAELLILDELARVLREQTSAKRGRAVFKLGEIVGLSGLLTVLTSLASVSTVSNACMRIATHPSALKIAIATGGVGLLVAGVLLVTWGANRWVL